MTTLTAVQGRDVSEGILSLRRAVRALEAG